MNQYEKGKHTPDFLTLKQLACPVALFYAEDNDLAEMIKIFHKMDKQNKKKLLAMANTLEGII